MKLDRSFSPRGLMTLDFTEAVITQPLLRITAEVRGGGSG
jgi:hypothetical protein